ncbi:MAG: flagellar biosynthesis protein FliQ [Pseudomonadota bacterium]
MSSVDALALFGDALWLIIIMVSVLVLPSLAVGLAVSVFQAATQINEQTLSFLPRLLATLVALLLFGPWLTYRLIDFSERVMALVPQVVA